MRRDSSSGIRGRAEAQEDIEDREKVVYTVRILSLFFSAPRIIISHRYKMHNRDYTNALTGRAVTGRAVMRGLLRMYVDKYMYTHIHTHTHFYANIFVMRICTNQVIDNEVSRSH